jgi:hypothetical protein
MKQTLSRAIQWMGLVASAVTLVMAYSYWYPSASRGAKPAILILFVLAAILLTVLIWREIVYSRKSRYSEVLGLLNDIHAILHDLANDLPTSTSQIKEACTRVSNLLAEAFSLITGTKCSVCVKVLEGDPLVGTNQPLRPKVKTLCRDDHSEKRRKLADSKSDVAHWIDQNTDFFVLHQQAGTPREDYFLSNHLPSYRGYVNTSFQVYGFANENLLLSKWLPMLFPWPLPYKSTVVLPIRCESFDAVRVPKLAGYLCVDSRSRGVFSRRYDPELLTGVADSLYPVLIRYRSLASEKQREAE